MSWLMDRRNFLSLGLGAGLASSFLPTSAGVKYRFPLIISTWDNRKANSAAMQVLKDGGSALDAVVAGINLPESDPKDRSVGYGGRPDRLGRVTLDACIMDHQGKAGSVTYVQKIKHPIDLARKVMELTPHVMLSGDGAEMFARSIGFPEEDLLTEESRREYEDWLKTKKYEPVINIERHDTIGLLVIDSKGTMAGGCSTSGMAYKMEGRVGDSPVIGAGLFVDQQYGACVGTGHGEYVLRSLSSFLVVEFMRQGMSPQKACEKAIKRIIEKNKNATEAYQVGLIAFNTKGNIGYFGVRKGFLCAVKSIDNEYVMDSKYVFEI